MFGEEWITEEFGLWRERLAVLCSLCICHCQSIHQSLFFHSDSLFSKTFLCKQNIVLCIIVMCLCAMGLDDGAKGSSWVMIEIRLPWRAKQVREVARIAFSSCSYCSFSGATGRISRWLIYLSKSSTTFRMS